MQLKAVRKIHNTDNTIGKFYIDDEQFCYCLEDIVRPATDAKVFGQTAIPAGTYKVILSHSPHFNRVLPELINVPGFSGVRIHGGNTAADSEGCLLIGYHTDNKKIWEQAADDLVEKLTGQKDIIITIE